MPFVILLLQTLAVAAWVIILGRVVMGWFDPETRRPISQFLFSLTEPFLAPIRRVLPQTGNIDFSPLVLLLGLSILMRVVIGL